MKRTKLPKLDLSVYEETLGNGLHVLLIPKEDSKGVYVTFTTKYGSSIDEFIPYGKKDFVKVPHGIAHFLEHKLFAQEDGVDPMNFFGERGAECNAVTNASCTCYLFRGSNCLEENINYLLDFVQSPYFTEENVEKEKGIIVQEAKMYLDSPGRTLYHKIMEQLLLENPKRYSTIGTVKEIKSITKEELYLCYETFYHPSNMIFIVSGNIEPEYILNIIKENQQKKKFRKQEKIVVKEYKEPDGIGKDVTKHMNVQVPKISMNFKVNIKKLRETYSNRELYYYFCFLLDTHFSETSLLNEQLVNEHIINGELGGFAEIVDDHFLFTVDAEVKERDIFIQKVKEEMRDLSITKKDFIRGQRSSISSYLIGSDSIYSIHDGIRNQMVKYGRFVSDPLKEIKNLKYENLKQIEKAIKDYQMGIVTILPNEKSL